jgi:flavodoxin
MKAAVIYYSLDGNCTLIAEQIASQLKADLVKVETRDTKKRSGFAKMFWGGSMVFSHKNPPIKPLTVDVNQYDLIILGVPVWAGSPAPPLASFLSQNKISGKKLGLFVCHGGGKGKSLDKLKALVQGNTIAGEIDFVTPRKTDKQRLGDEITGWINGLKG